MDADRARALMGWISSSKRGNRAGGRNPARYAGGDAGERSTAHAVQHALPPRKWISARLEKRRGEKRLYIEEAPASQTCGGAIRHRERHAAAAESFASTVSICSAATVHPDRP
jgi:hypothetical protein